MIFHKHFVGVNCNMSITVDSYPTMHYLPFFILYKYCFRSKLRHFGLLNGIYCTGVYTVLPVWHQDLHTHFFSCQPKIHEFPTRRVLVSSGKKKKKTSLCSAYNSRWTEVGRTVCVTCSRRICFWLYGFFVFFKCFIVLVWMCLFFFFFGHLYIVSVLSYSVVYLCLIFWN